MAAINFPSQVTRQSSAIRKARTLVPGEIVYDTDQGQVYYGNGSTLGGVLAGSFNVFNVRNYGAKGDGATDDTAAFQLCANDTCANNGRMYIPAPTNSYIITDTVKFNPPLKTSSDPGFSMITVEGDGNQNAIFYREQSGTPTNVYNGQPKTWDNYRPCFLIRNIKLAIFANLHVVILSGNRYVSGFDVVTINGPETLADGVTPYIFGSTGTCQFVNCKVSAGGTGQPTDWTGFRTVSFGGTSNGGDISYYTFQDCWVNGPGTTTDLDGLNTTRGARVIGFQLSGANSKEIEIRGGATSNCTIAVTTYAPSTNSAINGGVVPTDNTELKITSHGGSNNLISYLLNPGRYYVGPGRWENGGMLVASGPSPSATVMAAEFHGVFLTNFRPWNNGIGSTIGNNGANNSGFFSTRTKQCTIYDWSYNATTGVGTLTLPSGIATTGSFNYVVMPDSNKYKVGDYITIGSRKANSSTAATGNAAGTSSITFVAGHPYTTGDLVLVDSRGPYLLGSTSDGLTYNVLLTGNSYWKKMGVTSTNMTTRSWYTTRRIVSVSTRTITNDELNFDGAPSPVDQWNSAAVSEAACWAIGDLIQVGVGAYPHSSFVDFIVTAINGNVLTLADTRVSSAWTNPAPATTVQTGSGQTAGIGQQPASRIFPFASGPWNSPGDQGTPSGCVIHCNCPGVWNFERLYIVNAMGAPQPTLYQGASPNTFTLDMFTSGITYPTGRLTLKGCMVECGIDHWVRGGINHFINRSSGAWKYDVTDDIVVRNLAGAGLGLAIDTTQNSRTLGYTQGSTLALPNRQSSVTDTASNLPLAAANSGSGSVVFTDNNTDFGVGIATWGLLNITITSTVTLNDVRTFFIPPVHGYTVILTNSATGTQPLAIRAINAWTGLPRISSPSLPQGGTRQFTYSQVAPISGGWIGPNVLQCAPAPTVTATTGATSQINLSWTVPPGAATYTVRRSTSINGTYTAVSTAQAGTTFTDTGLTTGTTYFYEVTTINTYGDESYPSSATSAKAG